ncbi:MAG: bi-domain-containing oxidoreductase [Planctomycetales bacterium]|nr:bi-domain-containing oxidoreductase [Planctomycetales bacterium]
MQQLLQSLNNGHVERLEVPCPALRSHHLLIRTEMTLISAGTERMLVEFGKANLLQKARQQPDRVREVLQKIRSEGLLSTLDAVHSKLHESIPLGYCNVGVVTEVGDGCVGFRPGDRVVSNGPHAEVVCVPQNLCAKIPDSVANEDAVFTVVSAIGLQGVRLAEPTLGECFVVTGLGLIGLLTVQLLISHGCRVLGIDFAAERRALAEQLGAETVSAADDVVAAALKFSRQRGVDGVLVTASCKSDEPMHQAAQMSRKRGRIVLVGVAGLHLQRQDFYEKELSFQVSCSYGPGRYDPQYETRGIDYPAAYVRWTEQRNFEATLDQFASGRLTAAPLITHTFPFEQAEAAYDVITGDKPSLGVLLSYHPNPATLGLDTIEVPTGGAAAASRAVNRRAAAAGVPTPRITVIGAGNFSKRVLMPNLKRLGANIHCVASQAGLSAAVAARSQQATTATTNWRAAVVDEATDVVVVATRHDTHARMAREALCAGKHLFIEKPLAIHRDELAELKEQVETQLAGGMCPVLTVGFNRRFAPMIRTMRKATQQQGEPMSLVMTVNAGELPEDHWTHDPQVGGGRIIGEGCHFIDLLRFLVGQPILEVQATGMANTAIPSDKMSITLRFADGSTGAIHYLGNGHRGFPKERLEVFCAGQILQLDNYRRLRSYGWRGVKNQRSWRRDLGHVAMLEAFLSAVQSGGDWPIPWSELVETTEVCFDVLDAAESRETIRRPCRDASDSQTAPLARAG